jgi:hypothetical protein
VQLQLIVHAVHSQTGVAAQECDFMAYFYIEYNLQESDIYTRVDEPNRQIEEDLAIMPNQAYLE